MKKITRYGSLMLAILFTSLLFGQVTLQQNTTTIPPIQQGTIQNLALDQIPGFMYSPNSTTITTGLQNPQGIIVVGDEAFIANRIANEIIKVDLTIPNPPIEVLFTGQTSPIGIEVYQNNIYFITNGAGAAIKYFDYTVPNPVLNTLALVAEANNQQMQIKGTELFFTTNADMVNKIDLSAPSPTVEVVVSGIPNTALGLEFYNDIMYITTGDGALRSFDTANPLATLQVETNVGGSPFGLLTNGTNLYIANFGSSTIQVVDLTQPVLSAILFENNTNQGIALGRYNTDLLFLEWNNGTLQSISNVLVPPANAAPTAVCQDYTATLDASGNVTISGTDVDGGSTDPDGDMLTFSVTPNTFDCSAVGTPQTVTLTVDDGNGGTDSCMATVTVEDNEAPVITCPADITLECDEDTTPGGSSILLYGADSSGSLLNIDPMTGSTTLIGGTGLTNVGLAWTSPSDVTYARDFNNLYTLDLATATPTLIGASGNFLTALTANSTNTVLYSVGQGSRDLFEIDQANGTATLVGNTGIPDSPLGLATDLSGTVWVGTISGDLYTVDTNTGVATLQYSNPSGDGLTSMAVHPSTGSLYIVTLNSDNLVEVDLSTGMATIIGGPVGNDVRGLTFVGGGGNLPTATATDNCDANPMITYTDVTTPGSCPQESVITRTWTATDASGNSSNCVQTITIVDTVAPMVDCPSNVTVANDPGACGAVVTYAVNGTDNCGAVTVTQTGGIASGELFPVGTTTNTFDIADECGNTTTCSFDVTVEDNEAPVITCVPNAIRDTDPGVCEYTVQGTEFDATFTDNCMSASISNDYNGTATLAGDVLPIGDTTVIWTVDDGNGQTDTCTTVITVEDNEAPVITCVPNSIRDTDPGVCEYTVQGTEFDATFTDNCMSATISNDYNGTATIAGEVLPIGDTTVIWTVDDGNGQTDTCTTVITVEDNEAPVITCVADDNRDTDINVCTYTVQGTEFDATFTDNCMSATISNDYNGTTTIAGEVLPVGDTTVIWTVDDGNGQTATCTTVITVEDNQAPLMNCPADFMVGTDAGVCGAVVSFAEPIPLDNCGIDTVVQTAGLPSGSVFPLGDSVVEYTATDVNGNTTTCSFTITVVDDEAPMAVCMDITIQLDAFGNATIVPEDVDGGSTDNCGVDTLSIDIDTFTCADVGPNDVVLTVTDMAGNMSSCTAVVTVEDITPPTAVCQNITVMLDATGVVTIDPSLLDGGSTDACGTGNFTYSATPDTFTCAEVGDNTVTLTVTDENGNSATCEAVVTVVDDTDPVLVCQDITVELDENGMVSIEAADVIASAVDACGINATGVDVDDFTCDDIGTPVLVNVFANDVNGNIVTCTATVTVIDALAPTIECPDDQSVTVDNGAQYELPDYFADGLATATDNCTDPVTILAQDPAAGTLLAPGVYTISFTAEDAFGNVGSCEFELTVEEILGTVDNSFNLSSLTMYPNPATDFVMLSNPQQIPLQDVSIYDVMGRLIKTVDASAVTSEMRLDISELASATYMVLITTENGQVTKQLVKE